MRAARERAGPQWREARWCQPLPVTATDLAQCLPVTTLFCHKVRKDEPRLPPLRSQCRPLSVPTYLIALHLYEDQDPNYLRVVSPTGLRGSFHRASSKPPQYFKDHICLSISVIGVTLGCFYIKMEYSKTKYNHQT